ncbi:MAG TPA: radical SAM protein [Sphaerochaeta sp.]|nr:radical SAM protein [Sphaerochaeta sp.]
MKIQIVSCCLEEGNLSFPLGALAIQTAIESHPTLQHVPCTLGAYTLEDDPIQAARKSAESEATHIGCSIYLWNRTWFDRFAHHLKALIPSVTLFAGGTEVTANPRSFDLDLYDFLTLGEGEESTTIALSQLLEGTKLHGQGILTKGGELSYAFPQDLSTLNSVFLSGQASSFIKPGSSILWEMTRGCPFSCAFCFESKGVRSVRHFTYERIDEELEYLLANQVEEVFILDPTFNMDKKRTVLMLSLLVEKAQAIHFIFELRAELLDAELADLFGQLNCSLQIGLQSSSADVLNAINRRFDPVVFLQKIALLNERGIVFGLDLIIGLPQDSFALFCNSLDFTVGCKPSNIDIFALSLLPGTKLADDAEGLGIQHQKTSPYTVITTPTYPEEDIAKALKLKDACDLFYTKGEASMWMHTFCEAAQCTASTLFSYFATYTDFLKQNRNIDPTEMDIYELQEQFVRDLLKKLKRQKYQGPLLSFMELHQGVAFLRETGENPIITIGYELDDLAKLDTMHIEKFVAKHPNQKRRSLGIIENDDGSIGFVDQKL